MGPNPVHAQSAAESAPAVVGRVRDDVQHPTGQTSGRGPTDAAGRSVVPVALDVARRGGHRRGGPRSLALVIGTGAFVRVVLAALRARKYERLRVFSPSGRAATFAAMHRATAVDAVGLPAALATADLVVACSGNSPGVVDTTAVAALSHRAGSPLCIIGLALRPDVSAAVRAFDAVRVFDLRTVADHAVPGQAEAIAAAQEGVVAAAVRFEDEIAARQ